MARMSIKPPKEPPLFRIKQFKGIDLSETGTHVQNNQSPDMLNMYVDRTGALNKRTGYERVFAESLGEGRIKGMTLFSNEEGIEELLFVWNQNLYRIIGENEPQYIASGFVGETVSFFSIGRFCYIQDGHTLQIYDSSYPAVFNALDNYYYPTITISRPPAGGGEPYEDLNLIGPGFYESFSGDGSTTVYQLSLTGLDNIPFTAEVNGTVMGENSGFTVDRAKGTVTFTTAPSKGTNNVIITAYKTNAGFKERILKCTMNVIYGGANDTRVFVSGNPEYPNQVWRSGLYEPTYFPENGFYKVGRDNEKVQGFAKQYDYLVIEKEHTKWMMQFELLNGVPSFPVKPINDTIGTYAKHSIQVINNNPISLDKRGVHILNQSAVRDERNVKHISANVDTKLLNEPNLDQAISIDYDKKYFLAVNGNVYIYDYTIEEWFIYDNIYPSCFIAKDGYLYFGSNTDGMLYRFKKTTHLAPYNDDGLPINAYWTSKLLNFDAPEYNKIIQRVFYSLQPYVHTSCNVYIRTDVKGERLIHTGRMDQFNFLLMDFNRYSFITSDVPQEVTKKLKEKKITHFQIKLENKELDESLGITSLNIKYNLQSEVK